MCKVSPRWVSKVDRVVVLASIAVLLFKAN